MFLIYGLAFLLLALVAHSISRIREDGVSWTFLTLFGLIHGVNEWCDMVILAYAEMVPLQILRSILLVTSFGCLFEFGRRNVTWSGGRKLGRWIYYPVAPILLAGSIYGLAGFGAMARYTLAYPGAILAALALWRWCAGREGRWPSVRHILLALSMLAYAAVAGLVPAKADFWPASVFNTSSFFEVTGVPVQVVRCVLACVMSLALWREHVAWRSVRFSSPGMRQILRVEALGVGLVFLLLVGGWIAGERAALKSWSSQETNLLNQGRIIALSLNPETIQRLNEHGDFTGHGYDRVKRQFQRIADAAPRIRYIYLMMLQEESVRFVMDVAPVGQARQARIPNASPGEIYKDAPTELRPVFETGKAVVSKPYRDKWGNFVSTFFPITDPASGRVLAVLGVDENGDDWVSGVMYQRLGPLLIVAMVVLLFMILIALWRKTVEETEIRTAAIQRVQRQQAALFEMSEAGFARDDCSGFSLKEVVRRAGVVLRADLAEVWTHQVSSGEFRSESNPPLCVKEHPGLYELLNTTRALAADHIMREPRLAGLAPWFTARGIDSVILAPYRDAGELAGLVVFAQTAWSHDWMTDEVRFASEVADQISHQLMNGQRHKAELALRAANDELERKVSERTVELSRKNDQLYHEMMERLRVEDEQRKLEIQVQQTQKFESLGIMAGGIAHDFNNILMAIQGNVELAKFELPVGSKACGYLRDIEKAAMRAANLTRQMLAFSGRGHAVVQAVDLNRQVMDMNQILSASFNKKITVEYDFQTPLPCVDGDPSQIGQIVMNLVINAMEAIGDKTGVVLVRTGAQWYDAGMFLSMWRKESLPEGRYVYLEVVDTGCGMDEATQMRMFDPFFTTKFTGRGLGLATVMGIVKGHRGAIEVCSEVGKGSTIRVQFPEGQLAPEDTIALAVKKDPVREKGLILVVDDEEPVLAMGKKMVERLGFTALTAFDGVEAVRQFREKRGEIQCVLLDLTMPRMDGREVLEALRRIDPSVRVIICSGYNEDDVVSRFGDWKLDGFLQKPYSVDVLASRLSAVLC